MNSVIQSVTDIQETAAGGARGGPASRSFAKRIAEQALTYELTGRNEGPVALERAANEFSQQHGVPASTMKRCASEARALVEHAHASQAVDGLVERARGDDLRLGEEIAHWLDETSLPAVLKERALRLNRSRGGRPSSRTRTLRAVEELLEFARAGRPGALDELRSIRALFESNREPPPTRS
jgi:hypothetical protein